MGGCFSSGDIAVDNKVRRAISQNESAINKNNQDYVNELWKKYDQDKSGYLEFNELRSVIVEVVQKIHGKQNAMYFIPSHQEMKGYFKSIDADDSGEVSK